MSAKAVYLIHGDQEVCVCVCVFVCTRLCAWGWVGGGAGGCSQPPCHQFIVQTDKWERVGVDVLPLTHHSGTRR